jgi:hypothetical protein
MNPQTVEIKTFDQVFFCFDPTVGNVSSSISNLIENSIIELIGEF